MSLKKRAIEGVVVAGSLVMMGAIAETAYGTVVGPAAIAGSPAEHHTTGRTAGVITQLDEMETAALARIGDMSVGIERTGIVMVTSAGNAEEVQMKLLTVDPQTQQDAVPQAGAVAEFAPGTDEEQESVLQPDTKVQQSVTPQPQAGAVAEFMLAGADVQPDTEASQSVTPQAGAVAEFMAGADVQQGSAEQTASAAEPQTAEETAAAGQQELPEESAVWQNRLMADVQEFLYVREAGDENASIVGKLYKGDVAEIVERGELWTHVVSGNVDGYVLNSYCLFGTDAMVYAEENFDTKAEILTNGLRVRRSADTEGAVIAAVSTGTFLTVDTDAAVVDGWVAVSYGGETGYVSAEYVTTELALGEGITIEEERAAAAKAAEQAVAAKAAQVSSPGTVQNEAVAASVDDVTLLAALIQCEAGNEPYEGQLAVGAVVMNRVRSGAYPGSVYGVIYQGGQFTPAGSGSVANVAANGPKASCIQAAQQALSGMDNTGGAIHFQRASGGHAGVVIGNHVFF